jgi:LysM repeat protein
MEAPVKHLMSVALLSSLVAVGCSHDKSKDTQPTPPSELSAQPLPSPAPAPAPQYVAPSDTSVMAAPTPTPVTPKAEPAKKSTSAAKAAPAAAAASAKTYVVKKGDTLSEIAKAHNTTVKKLMAANPAIKSADLIEVGQKIKLP